jgi:polysaccharide biosynthesis protein PslH
MLAPQWPAPARQGAAIRNLHIARYLASTHRVTLLTFEADGPMDTSHLSSVCDHVEVLPAPSRTFRQRLLRMATSPLPDMAWRFYSEAMWRRVEELSQDEPFDAIHVEGIEMAPYGLLALQRMPLARMTYDAHNAEYLLQRRAFTTDISGLQRPGRALYSLAQWWRLRRFERLVALESRDVLAVSPADVAALERLSTYLKDRITLLPNGVDTEYWAREAVEPRPEMSGGDTLVFDGTLDFRPNVDAVQWFASEVWPIVRQERPEARFYIVGRNPAPEVQALVEVPGITVVGPVDDMRPWVAGATVYVVPMRMGGGVRLKVLQAMSMACSIVSTPMGAEGIPVRPGKDMLITFSPAGFAQGVLLLLSDRTRRQALGSSAQSLVTSQYAWSHLLPVLDSIYPGNVERS